MGTRRRAWAWVSSSSSRLVGCSGSAVSGLHTLGSHCALSSSSNRSVGGCRCVSDDDDDIATR
eukprot:14061972-Heterocapsa_arctica.AAC.1